jgi:exopolysaccharide biosynthesis protein
VNLLRVDLSQSQIVLTATSTNGLCQNGVQTTQFLQNHFAPGMLAMFAINANYFDMADRSIAYGLVVSQGNVVFPFDPNHPYEILISKDNAATIVDAGAGGKQDGGPWTAVSGGTSLVANGRMVPLTVVPPPIVAARSAIGLSPPASSGKSPQYLYLLTIDGLEENTTPYYGATLVDAAQWLLAAGAYNGFNLDGGGSTTMATISQTNPTAALMNVPHDDEHSNNMAERAVAVSFGVIVGAGG